MRGIHQPQDQLFGYRVNLEQRIRPDHPLRRVAQVIDFGFVRAQVACFYGKNGNEGVDPVILVKLRFLLFRDDVKSEGYVAVNDTHVCATNPDAALVSRRGEGSRARYHHHRAIDDAHGVITAVKTTPGSIGEQHKLMDLVTQHEENTGEKVHTVVGDHKYGTADNLAALVGQQTRTGSSRGFKT